MDLSCEDKDAAHNRYTHNRCPQQSHPPGVAVRPFDLYSLIRRLIYHAGMWCVCARARERERESIDAALQHTRHVARTQTQAKKIPVPSHTGTLTRTHRHTGTLTRTHRQRQACWFARTAAGSQQSAHAPPLTTVASLQFFCHIPALVTHMYQFTCVHA